jgi:hypothetical protein
MAMETLVEQTGVNGLGVSLENDEHTAWESFSAHEQIMLINDDLLAGRTVSIVFFSSIFIGLLLTVAAVVFLLFSV